MDIFEKYLRQHKKDENCRALVCKSYRKVYEQREKKPLDPVKTNFELATYGDAVLNLALCEIFLDKDGKLTERKQKFCEDKFLIENVAKHYNLLDYMLFDDNDQNIYKKYEVDVNDKNEKTKYIATTVEAVLGALFKEKYDFERVCKLVKSWTNF